MTQRYWMWHVMLRIQRCSERDREIDSFKARCASNFLMRPITSCLVAAAASRSSWAKQIVPTGWLCWTRPERPPGQSRMATSHPVEWRDGPPASAGSTPSKLRARLGPPRPRTFDFRGFTHVCGATWLNGWFTVKRLTSSFA